MLPITRYNIAACGRWIDRCTPSKARLGVCQPWKLPTWDSESRSYLPPRNQTPADGSMIHCPSSRRTGLLNEETMGEACLSAFYDVMAPKQPADANPRVEGSKCPCHWSDNGYSCRHVGAIRQSFKMPHWTVYGKLEDTEMDAAKRSWQETSIDALPKVVANRRGYNPNNNGGYVEAIVSIKQYNGSMLKKLYRFGPSSVKIIPYSCGSLSSWRRLECQRVQPSV